jgi:hypothetical protein
MARWAARTWTVTADGRLLIRQGILAPRCREIELASVRQPRAQAAPLVGWLGIGHLAFQVTGRQGNLSLVRCRWLVRCDRLQDLLVGRGQLPVDWSPRRPGRGVVRWLARRLAARQLRDHAQFMSFCHHLLHVDERGDRWPPPGVPAVALREWMAVLHRARVVVVAANDRGWRLGGGIRDLEDIRRRIGPAELARAVA